MTTEGLPLPPLPEPSYLGDDASWGYDENDMREYAAQAVKAARAQERERCAHEAECFVTNESAANMSSRELMTSEVAQDIAAAIRAMED